MSLDRFVFCKSWLDVVRCYPQNQQLLLLSAIIEIGLNPELKTDSYPAEIRPTLIMIKESIERMQKVYQQKSSAGKKGMQSRWKKVEIDKDFFIQKWNELNLINISTIEDKRESTLKNFLSNHTKDDFEKLIESIKKSDFLQGKNKRGFKATFDWSIENFSKIIDGNYQDKDDIDELWK